MKKLLLGLVLGVSFLFASIDLNTASKEELIAIKGIGEKKAQQIITFRKENKIKRVEELQQLKGFGKKLIESIKAHIKKEAS